MAPKQQLDKTAWQWAEETEPEAITQENIHLAYKLNLKPCKQGSCRRNCRGNPHCLVGLGEKEWLVDIDDTHWHDVEDPSSELREPGDFVGLKNLGATCYVNTFLQLWFHNLTLRSAILMLEEPVNDPQQSANMDLLTPEQQETLLLPTTVSGHLQLIFALLQHSKRKHVDPTPFINCLGLDAAQQQDAQEFSKLFMSLLEDTLSQQTDPILQNLIQQHFQGVYNYVTACSICGGGSRCMSRFYELDLNIKGHKSLLECLDEFLKEENLDGDNQYMCSNCNKKQNATRRIQLQSLPPVLNVQLLRFVFDRNSGTKKKLNTYIQFPEVLDMSDYLGQAAGSCVYDLYAVLIHRGPSAYSGHYIAHIKDHVSGNWFKFNDEEIEKMGGKSLHLGKEEELAESNSKNGEKKPKATKGCHSSRNAYMLVYCQRTKGKTDAPKILDEHQLPWRVRQCLELDNKNLEEWTTNMNTIRADCVSKGRARQTEIREILKNLPSENGKEFEWVPFKWINQWLSSDSKKIPEIINTPFLCNHQRLDPDKVNNMKCISAESAQALFSVYNGSPRLKGEDSLCWACVTERCRFIRMRTRINEDSKIIGALLKGHGSNNKVTEGYWVGKISLRSWKRLALQKLEDAQKDAETKCNGEENISIRPQNETGSVCEDAGETGEARLCEDKENLSKIAIEAVTAKTDEESFKFNEDLFCDYHGNLCVEEGSRRLIPAEIWKRLRLYFPEAPEFSHEDASCDQCRTAIEEEELAKMRNKQMAVEQRQCLGDLYAGRHRPTLNQDTNQLYLITTDFLEQWRKHIRDPQRYDCPANILNTSVLCPHSGFLFLPEQVNSGSERLELLKTEEWEHLKQYITVDVEICIIRIVESDGQVTFITQPDICDECCEAREEAELQLRLNYKNSKIYIHKLTPDHGHNVLSASNKTSPSAAGTDENDTCDSLEEADVEFQQKGRAPKRKKDFEFAPAEKIARTDLGNARRSSRHKRVRGEKEVTVSSTQTLRDLKLEIMKLFSVAPFDQHLHFNGKELFGDSVSLANHRILPGSVLQLKTDEPMEDPTFLEDVKEGVTEEGFKGTGLLGR